MHNLQGIALALSANSYTLLMALLFERSFPRSGHQPAKGDGLILRHWDDS